MTVDSIKASVEAVIPTERPELFVVIYYVDGNWFLSMPQSNRGDAEHQASTMSEAHNISIVVIPGSKESLR